MGADDELKAAIRRAALEARASVPARADAAAAIGRRLSGLAAYREAGTICWYVGVRDEVPTMALIARAAAEGRLAAVPWRRGDALELYRIAGPEDLEPASFQLLEPSAAVRADSARRVPPDAVDLFVVPGVAFDRRGGRLGYGRGFYDRLLPLRRQSAAVVGLAFEVQMVERIPTAPHDVAMDAVVTESAVYAPDAWASAGSSSR